MSDEKIYVAGSSNEIGLIADFMKIVREYGYQLTHDWTAETLWSHPDPSDAELAACAQIDEDGVRSADTLWYVVPAEGKSEGSSFELGVARALGKVILVSGTLDRHRIFPRLSPLRFSRHSEALECLRTRTWDTPEVDLLRMLAQADSVTIPVSHLGMRRAADALAVEDKVCVSKLPTGVYVVTRSR